MKPFSFRASAMPISQSAFMRATVTFLIVGLVALTAIMGSAIWLVERTNHYFEEVVRSRELRRMTNNLRIALHEVEASQRGFLITEAEPYLAPYHSARSNIIPAFERLLEISEGYPEYSAQVRLLRPSLELKLAEAEQMIDLVRQGRRDEAVALLETDRGKEIMDAARTLFSEIVATADRRLDDGVEEQRANASLLHLVALFGGTLILAVAGGSVWIAVSYMREIIAARAELENLNSGLEQRVNERTQDLLRANEEVQRFAYIVTHDLRAPLVNIMGFTSELDESMKSIQTYVLAEEESLTTQQVEDARTAASQDLPEAIDFIRSSTRKMDGLINAILRISRDGKRPIKPERIDLAAMLEANLASIHHQVLDAEGTTALDVQVPQMVTDRLSLEQIIGNLLDNAVKYRDPSRPLEIRVSVNRIPGRQIRIDVSDNGRGIVAEDHQRVFDLFRRSGRQDQAGEGIGLAHVRTLARSLGGDITLSSTFGEGTTFSVILPLEVGTATGSKA